MVANKGKLGRFSTKVSTGARSTQWIERGRLDRAWMREATVPV